jgi:uroporphyrinogen-III synthase
VLGGGGHVLFFSPETARVFVRLAVRAGGSVESATALAISEATRAALSPLPWRRIHVASLPTQDALLALLT